MDHVGKEDKLKPYAHVVVPSTDQSTIATSFSSYVTKSAYVVVTAPASFASAEFFCQNLNGNLVSFHSPAQLQVVSAQLQLMVVSIEMPGKLVCLI